MTVVKINLIDAAPGAEHDLERRFLDRIGEAHGAPGFLGAELLRPATGSTYFSLSRWESEEHFRAFAAAAAEDIRTGAWRGEAATDARLLSFDLVQPG